MRVIAGSARGKQLQSLPGEEITRPTINRVKEAMFSSVQFLVPGARVLDLFAGSGQLGIEALSCGAAGSSWTVVPETAARSAEMVPAAPVRVRMPMTISSTAPIFTV